MAKKPKIVEAAGVAAATLDKENAERAANIEAAMVKAVEDCAKKGITDPDKVRAAMLKARKEARTA